MAKANPRGPRPPPIDENRKAEDRAVFVPTGNEVVVSNSKRVKEAVIKENGEKVVGAMKGEMEIDGNGSNIQSDLVEGEGGDRDMRERVENEVGVEEANNIDSGTAIIKARPQEGIRKEVGKDETEGEVGQREAKGNESEAKGLGEIEAGTDDERGGC